MNKKVKQFCLKKTAQNQFVNCEKTTVGNRTFSVFVFSIKNKTNVLNIQHFSHEKLIAKCFSALSKYFLFIEYATNSFPTMSLIISSFGVNLGFDRRIKN
jgi:hypothetical protein